LDATIATFPFDDRSPCGPAAGSPVQFVLVSAAQTVPGGTPWILTGMSGAGKATAVRALEAAGVACVDNLPIALLQPFLLHPHAVPAVAVLDARGGEQVAALEGVRGARVLFLDAADAVLVRRLADSTRPHPCAAAGTGQAAVTAERAILVPLRAAADVVIDTGALTDARLAERVVDAVLPSGGHSDDLRLTVSSFGFKYGPPAEADWVVDSRVLPNPFWEPELRPLTGLDEAVRAFLLDRPETAELLDRSGSLLGWAVAQAQARGRSAVHVAVGCTGGRHRSVVVATELAGRLRGGGVAVQVRHRDVHRPDPR
jgi:UPF0042 nucleotide-binding protein